MPSYKYCIVPKCINTTAVTPNKLFFRVPRQADIRAKWCKAMKRNDKTPLSEKSGLYCCEDHFDVSVSFISFYLMSDFLLRVSWLMYPRLRHVCNTYKDDYWNLLLH